jgi:hypothetical protein
MSSLVKTVEKSVQPDSKIKSEWLVFSHVNETTPAQRVAIEVISLTESSIGDAANKSQNDVNLRLAAAMSAIKPLSLKVTRPCAPIPSNTLAIPATRLTDLIAAGAEIQVAGSVWAALVSAN